MIQVMIAAQHEEVGQGLRTLLGLANGIGEIVLVTSLSGAVEQARLARPDVLLVDLEMPGGEGYETIRQFKRLFHGIESIALTAHDYPSARSRAVEAGAWTVIVKGMGYQEIAAVIQAAADMKEKHDG